MVVASRLVADFGPNRRVVGHQRDVVVLTRRSQPGAVAACPPRDQLEAKPTTVFETYDPARDDYQHVYAHFQLIDCSWASVHRRFLAFAANTSSSGSPLYETLLVDTKAPQCTVHTVGPRASNTQAVQFIERGDEEGRRVLFLLATAGVGVELYAIDLCLNHGDGMGEQRWSMEGPPVLQSIISSAGPRWLHWDPQLQALYTIHSGGAGAAQPRLVRCGFDREDMSKETYMVPVCSSVLDGPGSGREDKAKIHIAETMGRMYVCVHYEPQEDTGSDPHEVVVSVAGGGAETRVRLDGFRGSVLFGSCPGFILAVLPGERAFLFDTRGRAPSLLMDLPDVNIGVHKSMNVGIPSPHDHLQAFGQVAIHSPSPGEGKAQVQCYLNTARNRLYYWFIDENTILSHADNVLEELAEVWEDKGYDAGVKASRRAEGGSLVACMHLLACHFNVGDGHLVHRVIRAMSSSVELGMGYGDFLSSQTFVELILGHAYVRSRCTMDHGVRTRLPRSTLDGVNNRYLSIVRRGDSSRDEVNTIWLDGFAQWLAEECSIPCDKAQDHARQYYEILVSSGERAWRLVCNSASDQDDEGQLFLHETLSAAFFELSIPRPYDMLASYSAIALRVLPDSVILEYLRHGIIIAEPSLIKEYLDKRCDRFTASQMASFSSLQVEIGSALTDRRPTDANVRQMMDFYVGVESSASCTPCCPSQTGMDQEAGPCGGNVFSSLGDKAVEPDLVDIGGDEGEGLVLSEDLLLVDVEHAVSEDIPSIYEVASSGVIEAGQLRGFLPLEASLSQAEHDTGNGCQCRDGRLRLVANTVLANSLRGDGFT